MSAFRFLLATLILVMPLCILPVFPAFAQDLEGGSVCFVNLNGLGEWVVVGAGVVIAVASTLANIVDKKSMLGKIVHWLAINIKVDKVK